MKLEFSQKILKKSSKISNFMKNPSSESCVIPCRQMDGHMDSHDEAKSCFSQFWKHAQ